MKKSDYLNKILLTKTVTYYTGPKSLYKYRPFDKYTVDMLEDKYVFLCVASALDDPSECVVTIDKGSYLDVQEAKPCFDIVNNILEFIRPYTSEEIYIETCNKLREIYNVSNSYEEIMNILGDTIKELACDKGIRGVVDGIKNMPLLIDNTDEKEKYEKVINNLIEARSKVGICALAESNDIESMWINYANNYSGYCIEYDMENYEYNKYLLPVMYEDQKETDLINSIVKNILGQTIFVLSKEQIDIERNQILKLLTTKDLKWSYQKEWRLIGDANFNLKAPKIKRVIIGYNANENDKSKMIEICEKLNIKVDLL